MPRFPALALLIIAVVSLLAVASKPDAPQVTVLRVPEGGIQPQAVQKDGVVHLPYFTGDPGSGELNYSRSLDYGKTFSTAIRVNSQPGSALATGNIRGGQIAIAPNGKVHVAWIGSAAAQPRGRSNSGPVLYARLNDAGTGFEAQRSLSQQSWGADGGTLAADSKGNVYVFWHAQPPGGKDESNRRLWMAKSTDQGRNFANETPVFGADTGICGCCGTRALAGADGSLCVLARSASELVHRDMWLLASADGGSTFRGANISQWNVGACVMSSEALVSAPGGTLAGWEAENQVYFGRVEAGANKIDAAIAAPDKGNTGGMHRKYPTLAANARGEILFAWTEGMAWKKGGEAAWQVYDRGLRPEGSAGKADAVPAWDVLTAFARGDGSFVVMY